jgi:hypothetical protein
MGMDVHKIIKQMGKMIQCINKRLKLLKNGYLWYKIEGVKDVHL